MGAKPRKEKNFEDSVIPLINIVFLLLIFFIMSGADKVFQFDLPDVNKETESQASAQESIYIQVQEDGGILVDEQPVAPMAIADLLRQANDETEVVVAASKNTRAVDIDPVLLALSEHKIAAIKILVSSNSGAQQ